MPIALPQEARQQAIASIEPCFQDRMETPIGNVAAAALPGCT